MRHLVITLLMGALIVAAVPAPASAYLSVGQYVLPAPYLARGIALEGTTLYVTASQSVTGAGAVFILDVTNPAAPVLLGTLVTASDLQKLTVVGSYAYICLWGGTPATRSFGIVDVSDPTNPALIGSLGMAGPFDVEVSGTTAFIGDGTGGMKVVDVSNPNSPNLLCSYPSPGYAGGVRLIGTTLYLAARPAGLVILDVSSPCPVSPLGSINPGSSADWSIDVDVLGGTAAVVREEGGMQLFDVTDPTNPIHTATIGASPSNYFWDVLLEGSLAYVTDEPKALMIYDVSDRYAPMVVDSLPVPSSDVDKDGTLIVTSYGPNINFIDSAGPCATPPTVLEYAGNPVLTPPMSGWDSNNIENVNVLHDGSQYYMYYGGREVNDFDKQIGLAVSPNGIAWTKYANPVIPTPGGGITTDHPTAIYTGSGFRMWYRRGTEVWTASSTDGVNWTGHVATTGLSDRRPTTVMDDGGLLKMWYWAPSGSSRFIGYATSSDGVAWTDHGSVLEKGTSGWDSNLVWHPGVVFNGTCYEMWYSGQDIPDVGAGIGTATSADGILWTKQGEILDGDESQASVMISGSIYEMWYKDGGQIPGGGVSYAATEYGPTIISIVDVPADQGSQVRIHWTASPFDSPDPTHTITGYNIYRQIPAAAAAMAVSPGHDPHPRLVYPPGNWEYVMTVPARGESEYYVVSPTLCDSTASGMCTSTFFVSAVTPDPLVYFDSPVASGYSVDNLAPAAPQNVAIVYLAGTGNVVTWDEVPDEDLAFYRIYKGGVEAGTTTDPTWTDPVNQGWGLEYKITAVDFAGNESDGSNELAVGIGSGNIAMTFGLQQNVPNPFNPTTTISYVIPERATVSLQVFDVSGRLVRTITNGEQAAGQHSETWDGRDSRGHTVASGVYFYRLKAGSLVETRKMTLAK